MEPKRSLAKVTAFSADVLSHGGYRYSTNAPLSSQLANGRITSAVFELVDFRGRSVIDVGCGDGIYTLEISEAGNPLRVHASDLAAAGVRLASERAAGRAITFDVSSAYQMPFADKTFDVAHLRGVLHHMDDPALAIREALRVARQVIVVEPNGYNLGLKLLERFSKYHIEHQERSYTSLQFNRWVREAGGVIKKGVWIGLVPMFCPDWLAKIAKTLEPQFERVRPISALACAQYVFLAGQAGGPQP